MALFRKPIPRRALWAAVVGFAYGALLLLLPSTPLKLAGVGWSLLSLSLLFARRASYYTFVTFALLWMVWKAVEAFQGRAAGGAFAAVDVVVPLVAIALLSSSGYVEAVSEPASAE